AEALRDLDLAARTGEVAGQVQREREVVVGLREAGLDADRVLEVLARLRPLLARGERHAPLELGLDVLRVDLERLLELLDRFFRMPLLEQEHPESVASRLEPRLGPYGLSIRVERALDIPLVGERVAEEVVRRRIRVQADRGLVVLDGGVAVAGAL